MTKKRARIISLLLWRDMAENGWKKKGSSKHFYLVENMLCFCPLCELGMFIGFECTYCPLAYCMDSDDGLFQKWTLSTTTADRKKHAKAIYDKIKGWRV